MKFLTKRSWFTRDLLGFSLTSFFNDFNHEMITSILPLYIFQLFGAAHAPQYLGIIAGVSKFASMGANLISGWLSEKINNQKILLIVGYSLTPLFSSLIGAAHHVFSIVLFRTIAWSGRGLREPVRDAWLSNSTETQHYGKVFGVQRAMDTLGALCGPLLAYFLLSQVSVRSIFFIALIPGFFSVISLMYLVKNYTVKQMSTKSITLLHHFIQLPRQVIFFIGIRFLFGIAYYDRMLIILRAQESMTGQAVTTMVAAGWSILLYSFFNGVRLFSEMSIGWLSDAYKLKRKYLLAVCGCGVFGLLNCALLFKIGSWWYWLLIFLAAGLSVATITVLEKAYLAQLLPHQFATRAYSFLAAADGASALCSGLIVGMLWSHVGAQSAFIFAAVISFVSLCCLMFVRE